MTALQASINEAIRSVIDSSSFSFRSPAVSKEVWTTLQGAPDSVCEEFVLLGEHVLRTCFLSVMLKRDLLQSPAPRANGLLTVLVPHSFQDQNILMQDFFVS